jgi:hypothetical protein
MATEDSLKPQLANYLRTCMLPDQFILDCNISRKLSLASGAADKRNLQFDELEASKNQIISTFEGLRRLLLNLRHQFQALLPSTEWFTRGNKT